MTRQAGTNVNCSVPDVVVSSVYVPSELRVHVPVTCRDPVTGADEQPAAKPNIERSSSPDTFRHDDVAVHVPTRLPPQGVPLEQDAVPPPLLPLEPDTEPPPEPEPPSLSAPLGEGLPYVPHAAPTTAGNRRMCEGILIS